MLGVDRPFMLLDLLLSFSTPLSEVLRLELDGELFLAFSLTVLFYQIYELLLGCGGFIQFVKFFLPHNFASLS